jgi:hypothetical protein
VHRAAIALILLAATHACAAPSAPARPAPAPPAPASATPAPPAPPSPQMTTAEAVSRLHARAVAAAWDTPEGDARMTALLRVVAALPPRHPQLPRILRETERVLSLPSERREDERAWGDGMPRLAAAWLARGDREEARRIATLVDARKGDLSHASTPIPVAVWTRLGDRGRGMAHLSPGDDAVVAVPEAEEGDLAWAELTVGRLDQLEACKVLASIALRHARAGRRDVAAAAWARADEVARTLTLHSGHGTCLAALARSHALAGDPRAAEDVLALLPTDDVSSACAVLRALVDEPLQDLLDVPVLIADRHDRESPLARMEGCPTLLAEAAARRGDTAMVLRLLRHWPTTGVFDDRFIDRVIHVWMLRVRLGLQDPCTVPAPAPTGDEAPDPIGVELSLARVMAETPERTVGRACFDARFPAPASAPASVPAPAARNGYGARP